VPRALSDLEKSAHEFLFNRDSAGRAGTIRDTARDILKGWLTLKNAAGKMVNGEVDDKGNRTLYFDEPLTIGEKTYTGVQAQRKEPAQFVDEDAAEKLLKSKGQKFYDAVFKRQVIRVFSEDDLYVLNQRGIVTDEELDSLLKSGDPSYALVVVTE
jgi:hypothetical protein